MQVTWITCAESEWLPGGRTSRLASMRYRVLLVERHLDAADFRTAIIDNDTPPGEVRAVVAGSDLVVFSKINWLNPTLIDAVSTWARCPVVFDVSDDHFHHPDLGSLYRRVAERADCITVPSEHLGQSIATALGRETLVIPDPVEGTRRPPRARQAGTAMRLFWFGYPTNFGALQQQVPLLLEYARRVRRELALHLVSSFDPGFAALVRDFNGEHGDQLRLSFADWSHHAMEEAFASAEIAFIPQDCADPRTRGKSANRVTEAIWAGCFVVAHPVPSYCEYSPWAWIADDLVSGIDYAYRSPDKAIQKVRAGQSAIASTLTPALVADRWSELFRRLGG